MHVCRFTTEERDPCQEYVNILDSDDTEDESQLQAAIAASLQDSVVTVQ